MEEKFCKFCGEKIPMDAVICTRCGRQVEELKTSKDQPNIIINNENTNTNTNTNINANYIPLGGGAVERNKWVALLLCLFLGLLGAHKFYEFKYGMGVLYILTFGLFGIGIIVDLITLLFKPNPYYV